MATKTHAVATLCRIASQEPVYDIIDPPDAIRQLLAAGVHLLANGDYVAALGFVCLDVLAHRFSHTHV